MPDNITRQAETPQIANAPAIARILSRCDRRKLDHFIEIALELVDVADGDPDLEATGDELDGDRAEDEAGAELYARLEDGPGCNIGDPGEHSIQERHGKQPELKQSPADENREDNEGGGDTNDDEDEPNFSRPRQGCGAGCSIADPGGCEHDGREPDNDAECEQMQDDVPCILAYSLEPNVFTGEREYLGLTNLQPSFVGNGQNVKSAD